VPLADVVAARETVENAVAIAAATSSGVSTLMRHSSPRPILQMHWTRARKPKAGCFLRNSSPRARIAYETVEIKGERPAPLGGVTQRLVCNR